jgi:hypothetical protein
MEKYLIIDYALTRNLHGDPVLHSLSASLLNPTSPDPTDSLSFDGLQDGECFQTMLVALIQAIFAESLKFANICLVAPRASFFTEILEEECVSRGLTVPFVFRNYMSLQEVFARRYGRALDSLQDMMRYCSGHLVSTRRCTQRRQGR